MPKRTDIKKIMVIGSGPIVIGQAAEFDYAGTQACLAIKEEGYKVILVNSNPATIMTDTNIADKVYMEPLDLEHVAKIIRYERPDGLICSIGGQTGLNLGMQLARKGILEECNVELLGTSAEAIEKAEDRELFKELCIELGEPIIDSLIANHLNEVIATDNKIKGYLQKLNIDRRVNSFDRSFYRTWTYTYKFNDEIIDYAIELSTNKTNGMQYANVILTDWNDKGVKTLEEAKKQNVNQEVKNSNATFERKSFVSRTYTSEELEALFDNLDEIDLFN